jgi:hypothetical protein
VVLGDHEDTIQEQHNLISDNYVPKTKTPKKVEYWCYQEVKSVLRERIHYLESELLRKENQITEILSRSGQIRETIQTPNTSSKEPVGRKNPVKILAQMEAKDREDYWKKEIARREKLVKEEGNATTPETAN